jgi:hypothetical protein
VRNSDEIVVETRLHDANPGRAGVLGHHLSDAVNTVVLKHVWARSALMRRNPTAAGVNRAKAGSGPVARRRRALGVQRRADPRRSPANPCPSSQNRRDSDHNCVVIATIGYAQKRLS